MLKLPFSLALASYAAATIADDVNVGPWDGVWEQNDIITGPLSEKVIHAPDSTEHECYAIQGPPMEFTEQYGQFERYCTTNPGDGEKSCCSPNHDVWIYEYMKPDPGLFPRNCALEVYPGLKELVCLPCHPKQPDWTDSEKKIIRICKSLVQSFYGSNDLNSPTSWFESCGAWKTPDPEITANDPLDPSAGFSFEQGEDYIIYPKGTFKNAEEFYFKFDQAKIPFMENFKIMVVDDVDAVTGEKNICYSSSVSLANFVSLVLAATALNFIA